MSSGITAHLNRSQKKEFTFVVFLSIVQSFIEVLGLALIIPFLYFAQDIGKVADNQFLNWLKKVVGINSNEGIVIILAVALIIFFLLKSVLGLWLVNFQTAFSHKVARRVLDLQVSRILSMDYLYFKQSNSNKLVQDMATIPIEFASLVIQPMLMIVSEISVILIIATGMAIYNFKVLVGLCIIVIPPVVIFYRLARVRISELGKRKNEVRPKAYKYLFGAIHGIESVKVSHSADFFRTAANVEFKTLFDKTRKLVVHENVPIRIIELVAVFSVCLLVLYSVLAASNQGQLIPLLVVFATAAYRLMPSINRIVSNSIKLKGAGYVLDRLKTDFNSISKEDLTKFESSFENEIQMVDVYYKYPGKDKFALDGVSLSIGKGQVVGIIGKSGEGKSTLLRVFLKLLEHSEGKFLVDGVKLKKENRYSWQEKIGYVEQSTYIFDDSIERNIALGSDKIDEARLFESLKNSALSELVDSLPNGVKSQVGEFGATFSGGQRQRLAIARALYRKNVEILVLDEATSALDRETEESIIQTIFSLKKLGLTIIMVSHNVKSMKACDKVFQMHEGRVVKEMTYEEAIKL